MPISLGTTTITALFLGTTSITSAYLGATQVFGGASAFTPLSLFSGGAQGIWLDPSDLSTMFSDRAGTTPVTTPGTVVGLRLDKSKGLALGAELVTNGDFPVNTTGWTPVAGGTNAEISAVSGRLRVALVSGASPWASQSIACVVGKSYRVSFNYFQGTAGSTRVIVGTSAFGAGSVLISSDATGSGIYSAVFTASNATMFILLQVGTNIVGAYGEFDNISVRELAGNHAQAPTDAARPVYGIEPKGGRRNLLLATDTLATQSLTVTAVAHTLAFTGTGTVTLSGASTAGPLVGTGAGDRVSLTFTPTAASLTLTVSGSVTLGQLELGSSATAYQKVVTAYNVTESGVPTCHYVQYDGSDDSMSTAAIDFTSTDKMSVFAGVRKLSDTGAGVIAELGSSPTVAGSFTIAVSTSTGDASRRTWYLSQEALSSECIGAATGYPSPDTRVQTALFDRPQSTPESRQRMRLNGSQQTLTGLNNNACTGNFGNWPLFIGRRNNAGNPFNGKDYGLIIVGKAASAGEISDTETWLAARTAQVTL